MRQAMAWLWLMPAFSGGKLYEYKNFPTSLIQARNVYVWVPENYSSQKRYDVVYMHDGLMLLMRRQRGIIRNGRLTRMSRH